MFAVWRAAVQRRKVLRRCYTQLADRKSDITRRSMMRCWRKTCTSQHHKAAKIHAAAQLFNNHTTSIAFHHWIVRYPRH